MAKTKPITNIEIIKKIKDFYLQDENYRDLLIFLLAINTGLKLKFILDLNICDVKGKKYIYLQNKITEKTKKIFFSKEIIKLVKKISLNSGENEPLFKSKSGHRLERTSVFRNLKNVCKNLKINNISFESLRKTFGFHYYQKTGDLLFLQTFFNQQTIDQTLEFIGIENSIRKQNLIFSILD